MEPITLKRQLESTAAPQALWSALADTSRLYRALGQVPLTYRPLNHQPNSAARFEMFSERAWGGLVFWELPVEWQTPERLVLRREYPRGPMSRLETHFALSPQPQGTRLAITLVLAPRSSALRLLLRLYGEISMRQLLSTLRRIEADMTRGAGLLRRVTALDVPKLTAGARAARGALSEVFSGTSPPGDSEKAASDAAPPSSSGEVAEPTGHPLLDRLLEHVAQLDDLDDDTLHPYALAAAWGVSPNALLGAFLAGAAHGLFSLQWDLVCPVCRRPAQRVARLADLPESATCPRCDIAVPATLHDRVVGSFAVAPRLRAQTVRHTPEKSVAYAIGGPSETPHIDAQILLPATGMTEIRAPRAPGDYEIFVRGGLRARLNVSTLGGSSAGVQIGETIVPASIEVAMGGTLNLTHEHTQPRHLAILRGDSAPPFAVAHRVTMQPLFRRLLAVPPHGQWLPPGRLFPVPQVALLHTDLAGLVELQGRAGETEAFRFVDAHFAALRQIFERPRSLPRAGGDDEAHDSTGVVVRSERDGLLAAFADAEDAALAAIEAQQAFLALRESHPSAVGAVGLRVGVYAGPAHLVTPGDSHLLDYFGATLGLCLRLLREAHPGDIVLPADLGEALGKRPPERSLDSVGLKLGPRFMLSVRGVAAPVPVMRIQLQTADRPGPTPGGGSAATAPVGAGAILPVSAGPGAA